MCVYQKFKAVFFFCSLLNNWDVIGVRCSVFGTWYLSVEWIILNENEIFAAEMMNNFILFSMQFVWTVVIVCLRTNQWHGNDEEKREANRRNKKCELITIISIIIIKDSRAARSFQSQFSHINKLHFVSNFSLFFARIQRWSCVCAVRCSFTLHMENQK